MRNRAIFVPMESWEGEHKSYKQKISGLHTFSVSNHKNTGAARLKAYNEITKELQGIVAKAVNTKATLRAQGSSWSLSKVGVSEHELINTKALRIGFSLPKSQISKQYRDDHRKLRFLECGASVAAVNRYLYRSGLSIKTSGSNNGQTLAGAISTGTHGSAFRFGSCQDFVVGLHLICGPSRHIYLERESHPVVKPSFAAKLGAEFVRDDQLFNAALVSFGSFGIIHGTMIESRDLFLLHAHRFVRKYSQGIKKAISQLDFSKVPLPGPVSKLHHFEVIFNPNAGTPPAGATLVVMFEEDWHEDYEPPEWDDGAPGPGASALELMGELVGIIPSPLNELVKPVLNSQVADQLKPYEKTGAIKDIFRGEKVRGKTLSSSMGIDLSNSLAALDIAFSTYAQFGAVLPILISVRFVKGSKALLGFTRFENTCLLEIDAINTKKTRDFLKSLWKNLESADIPFTLHWGKFNSYLTKTRVKKIYGHAVDEWKTARMEILENTKVANVFTNDFTRKLGLTDSR